ncbi:hypothetical protein ACHAWO_001811 [Cyclotella atomus]|uniref:Uncharacterized protein n=1 Tax=Cyclotella atomus TaxID=382360 RepID=A0ABD3MVE4_9STRA
MVADYVTTDDRDRLEHSKQLTLVFEEAADLFQERRQRLNDLALKKFSHKQKSLSKPIDAATTQSVDQCSRDVSSKAGRTLFPILVGHEEYLYKSSKTARLRQVFPCNLDLHGCTGDEALLKLSSTLPNWLDAAMKEHPYTLPDAND